VCCAGCHPQFTAICTISGYEIKPAVINSKIGRRRIAVSRINVFEYLRAGGSTIGYPQFYSIGTIIGLKIELTIIFLTIIEPKERYVSAPQVYIPNQLCACGSAICCPELYAMGTIVSREKKSAAINHHTTRRRTVTAAVDIFNHLRAGGCTVGCPKLFAMCSTVTCIKIEFAIMLCKHIECKRI